MSPLALTLTAVATLLACALGGLLGWLLGRRGQSALAEQRAVLAEQLRQAQMLVSATEDRLAAAQAQQAAALERAQRAESETRVVAGQREAQQALVADWRARHEAAVAEQAALAAAERTLRGELAGLRERHEGLREQFEQQKLWFAEQTHQLRLEAEQLTSRILEEKTQRFTALNAERLGELLNPLREQLGDFKQKVEQVYTDEAKERSALKAQVEQLHALNRSLSDRTESLTQALTTSGKTQGDWGELVLARLFEVSGLQEGREYRLQDSILSDEGARQRPDAVIYLPEDRQLVIDAKVSLTAWTDYGAARDDGARDAALKRHLLSIRQHLRDLAQRDYTRSPNLHTIDFVIMFVPIEAALLVALREDETLYTEAFRSKVVLVSPTTLFAVIKMVESLWSVRRREQNAEKIAEAGAKLYKKLDGFVRSFEQIDKALVSAQKAFDQARRQLHAGPGNVLKQAGDMSALGLRSMGKSRIAEILAGQDPDAAAEDGGDDRQDTLPPAEDRGED